MTDYETDRRQAWIHGEGRRARLLSRQRVAFVHLRAQGRWLNPHPMLLHTWRKS